MERCCSEDNSAAQCSAGVEVQGTGCTPGVLETLAREFWPVRAFTSDDLPTLERPMTAQPPAGSPAGTAPRAVPALHEAGALHPRVAGLPRWSCSWTSTQDCGAPPIPAHYHRSPGGQWLCADPNLQTAAVNAATYCAQDTTCHKQLSAMRGAWSKRCLSPCLQNSVFQGAWRCTCVCAGGLVAR